MAGPALSLSVVMATRNRRAMLERVLPPLVAQPAASEIVVTVDGSNDGTVELLERLAADRPQIRPVVIPHSGAAAARRAGVLAAQGEVVLILDDDVIASPGLAEGHARHHAGGERKLVLGYMPLEERPLSRGDYPRAIYGREYERTTAAWEEDPEAILRSMWFGNISMRRDDYLALTEEDLVVGYHEDMEFGLRCLEAGLTGVFDRSLIATHIYDRDAEGFMRDARASGKNFPEVYARHRELLGDLPRDAAADGLPRPLRPLVAVTAALPPLRGLLRVAVEMAGRLRLFTLERHGGSLLWRAEQARAMRAAG